MRTILCTAAILCCLAPERRAMAATVSCKYRKIRGQGYHSPAVWQKVPSYEEAVRTCDQDEECTGFHYHPITKLHYLFKHGTELIQDPYVDEFTAYKKRMLTCEGPKDDQGESEVDPEEEEEEDDEGSEL
mmetsp:Transcript_11892/g.26969  ORF Transcript_11892/g.26969 Transcript_11892/m.26969 type:complete len:130 (-) Transcript_11892:302-691(-)